MTSVSTCNNACHEAHFSYNSGNESGNGMQIKIEAPAESMFHILGTEFPNDWTVQMEGMYFEQLNKVAPKITKLTTIPDGCEQYCRGLFITPDNYVIPYYDDFDIVNFRPVYSTGFHLVKRKGNDAIVQLIFANGWTEKVVEVTIPNMFIKPCVKV